MSSTQDWIDPQVPALVIGLGGTGAELLLRCKAQLLARNWGSETEPVQFNSLRDLPFVKFLLLDTDNYKTFDPEIASVTGCHPIRSFDDGITNEEAIYQTPILSEWFPPNAIKRDAMHFHGPGATHQIRANGRAFVFNRYKEIKSEILKAIEELGRYGDWLKLSQGKTIRVSSSHLRIIVISSAEGGTGSGMFIDIGYLTRALMKRDLPSGAGTNQLMLILPTSDEVKTSTLGQANTYAALMELESSMRGSTHVGKWAENDDVDLPPNSAPYGDVYFFDKENIAGEKTETLTDCFDIAAGVLVEGLFNTEFANRRHRLSFLQRQHKVMPYATRVDREKYGDLKLPFSRSYSAFGQAILDTQHRHKQGNAVEHLMGQMLGLFFGVSTDSDLAETPQPTECERDELLGHLHLKIDSEVVEYDFSAPHDRFKKGAECLSAPIVKDLLRVNGSVLIDSIEANIVNQFENVQNSIGYKEWPVKLQELLSQIQRDTIKNVEAGTGIHEDGIETRGEDLLRLLLNVNSSDGVIKALWTRVDSKEKGGLDFTIELITRMKDRMENQETGWVKTLGDAEKTFAEMSGFILNTEIAILKEHLDQAVGKWVGGESVAKAKWNQLCQASQAFVRYRLLSVACREAAKLVKDLSKGLGFKSGTDSRGEPIWDGCIGELERGRQNVLELMQASERRIVSTEDAMKQRHSTYTVVPTPADAAECLMKPPKEKSQEWAKEAFEDLGGIQELFRMLDDKDGREDLVAKLRNQALGKLSVWGKESGELSEVNPLFTALENLPDEERKRLLAQTMRQAMPWVAIKLDEYLKKQSPEDQFHCIVGVKDRRTFEEKFAKEMLDAIPSNAKMTANRVLFVEICEPGKLVCYVELTGFPAPALKGIEKWYSAYQTKNDLLPTHTYKNLDMFVHVRELQLDELAERKKDLELLIQSLALGQLKRAGLNDSALILNIDGLNHRVGKEKSIRLNGLLPQHREKLIERVDSRLEKLSTPEQLALWWALMDFYKERVYPILVVLSDANEDSVEKHLPTLVCENLASKALHKLVAADLDETALQELKNAAKAAVEKWTDEIVGSESDPYFHEVNQGSTEEDADDKPQAKRAMKEAVFDKQWRLVELDTSPAFTGVGNGVTLPPPFGVVPPVTVASKTWHISVAGVQYGPFTKEQLHPIVATKQFTAHSMVWSEGMPSWIAASAVPEFASWFTNCLPATCETNTVNDKTRGINTNE